MNRTQTLLAAFFLLFLGFSQTASAQKDTDLLSYRIAQNEKLAINAIRQISGAQATYQAISVDGNFGTLQQLAQAELIDNVLATGKKYGYTFTITVQLRTTTTPSSFFVTATPQYYKRTGLRSFFVDVSGIIRGGDKNGEPANRFDFPIPEMFTCGSIAECEQKAISSLRVLGAAEATYYSTAGNNREYGSLCQLEQAGFIDELLASGGKFGYYFIAVPHIYFVGNNTPVSGFKAFAIPQNYGTSGRRSFFLDESGVIRGVDRNGAPANQNDPPITDHFNCNSIEDCEYQSISALRTIVGAQATFEATTGNYGSLQQLKDAGLIDEPLASGSRSGYSFALKVRNRTQTRPPTFEATAVPNSYNKTGRRSFFVDHTGIVRGADRNGAPANADDPPIN